MCFLNSVGLLGLAATLVSAPSMQAHAQACRQSTYIPGLNPLVLQHVNGTTVGLQRDSRDYRPTAHVWVDGVYQGEFFAPFSFAGDSIQVLLKTGMGLETWMGSVRQATKVKPFLVVCGEWYGQLP